MDKQLKGEGVKIKEFLPKQHHASINWEELIEEKDVAAVNAPLDAKSLIVGRVGIMLLSVGTGGWRVLDAMNVISKILNIKCNADIGLTSINVTCFTEADMNTQSLSIGNTGINTDKLDRINAFLREFVNMEGNMTLGEVHRRLEEIMAKKANYSPVKAGMAAGIACFGFTFLLGGGIVEMICAFIGAFFGNWFRRVLIDRKVALIANVSLPVAFACTVTILIYIAVMRIWGVAAIREAGYVCAILFVIPGFPLINGGFDLAKLHLRSGIERITYAMIIILTATYIGWIVAYFFNFHPGELGSIEFSIPMHIVLRILCSFLGVFGFSLMYDSPKKMAFAAACIGMIANTLRLELVDLAGFPPAFAAFCGALTAGLLAAVVCRKVHMTRIALSIPSIVIMVPGMYMYEAFYKFGTSDVVSGAGWFISACLVVMSIQLGLIAARIITDERFRRV